MYTRLYSHGYNRDHLSCELGASRVCDILPINDRVYQSLCSKGFVAKMCEHFAAPLVLHASSVTDPLRCADAHKRYNRRFDSQLLCRVSPESAFVLSSGVCRGHGVLTLVLVVELRYSTHAESPRPDKGIAAGPASLHHHHTQSGRR